MLQAYVDETGADGNSPVFLFSALICEAIIWAKFSTDWDSCLRASPSIRYFKMDEAAGRSDEFYRFSIAERDEKVKQLCHILGATSAVELSCSMDMGAFGDTWGKTAGKPLSEHYFFPFHITNIAVAHQVGDLGATEPYEIFFDEQRIFGPRAKAWYPIMRAFQDEPVKALMPVEPFFHSDRDILPLQAADLIAWIERAKRGPGLGDFGWILAELDGLFHSNLSTDLDNEWMRRFTEKDNSHEYLAKHEAALKAYEETFGHEWPPRNKKEQARMRGR
jgi:hypothetical protein